MEEQFVSFQQALRLRNLGFYEPCLAGFNDYQHLKSNISSTGVDQGHDKIIIDRHYTNLLAPLWQQAFDWISNKYHIHVEFIYDFITYDLKIYSVDDIADMYIPSYFKNGAPLLTSMAEARTFALDKLLQIIENQ